MNNKIIYPEHTKAFKKAVSWLNKNKNRLPTFSTEDDDGDSYTVVHAFDYPDYWGMPKKIANRLDSDELDWLQEQVSDWKNKKVK